MELSPRISIITPSFNQGIYIEETILSVIGQHYPNLEYLIIDGGSTDNTIDVIKKYENSISYWISEKDKGQSDAINKGLKLATGSIICWINSDDILIPGALKKVANYFQSVNTPALVFGNSFKFKEERGVGGGTNVVEAHTRYDIYKHDYISQPSTFWNRPTMDILLEVSNEFDFVMDWDFFIRAKSNNVKFIAVNDFFSIYRYHSMHKTSSGGNKRNSEIMSIIKKYNENDFYSFATEVYKKRNLIKKINRLFGYPPTNLLNSILLKVIAPSVYLNKHRNYASILSKAFT